MSYKHYEIKDGRKLTEMTIDEQEYIKKTWDRLCARKPINNSELVFAQKPNGRFIEAKRGRINADRYGGCSGGYWAIQYGNCRCWGFKKNPFGEYDPEQMDKYFSSVAMSQDETIAIPRSVHTKKEVLELVKKLGFEL